MIENLNNEILNVLPDEIPEAEKVAALSSKDMKRLTVFTNESEDEADGGEPK